MFGLPRSAPRCPQPAEILSHGDFTVP